jgi:hypothetical protein
MKAARVLKKDNDFRRGATGIAIPSFEREQSGPGHNPNGIGKLDHKQRRMQEKFRKKISRLRRLTHRRKRLSG